MASLRFLVFALCFTCLWLACSSAYVARDYKQTEIMNPNDETDVKKPEQYNGGYGTGSGGGYQYGQCKFGCCYRGPRGCIRCCKYANKESYAVGMHKRGQVAKKAKEQEASPMSDSWSWKSLLRLRSLAEAFVFCKVGKGNQGSFWYDTWTPYGPLIKFIGQSGPRKLRVPLRAKIRTASNSAGWNIAHPRSEEALLLHIHLTMITPPTSSSEDDTYFWRVSDINHRSFNSSKTWDFLRPADVEKLWASSVWFKGATPRNAFTMWLATLDRLPTRARLVSWGMDIQPYCCICLNFEETREHLFLSCDYSIHIWKSIQQNLGLEPISFATWSEMLAWTTISTPTAPCLLRKLAAQAAVFYIWKQRNNKLHNNQIVPQHSLFVEIDRHIRDTITARRHRKHFRDLMILWLH